MNDLHIDLAEPDAPAPVGDYVPRHLFFAPLREPLPPVLRRDRAPAGSLLDALARGWAPTWTPPRPRRSWLRRLWDDHHEWITVGAILTLAAAFILAHS